ncbi:Heavy metal-associated isoprenylated plant protein 46 [Zea mays]|uniref:Heavy metal-associated isoprenylated plant protein 46 n=1 Tax=Zea mays TaxID=4577 RepID=A0A3L6FY08_MAIZE|nr:Heavy metal-associated isoprenylated plant protein 46 [Zea mays]
MFAAALAAPSQASCRLHLHSASNPSAPGATAIVPSVHPHTAQTCQFATTSAGPSGSAMKQKIVIKVCMPCDKCRSKAMGLAAKAGVSKMGITGDGRDQLEVEGDDIDTVCLVNCLRKKAL